MNGISEFIKRKWSIRGETIGVSSKVKRRVMQYYQNSTRQVFDELESTPAGLSQQDAGNRLEKYGPNELPIKGRRTSFDIFLDQFQDFLIILLILAAAVSFGTAEYLNGIVLFVIVLINVLMSFFQERKAEKALEALHKISAPKAKVRRGNYKQKIPSLKIVPGDVVVLEPGDRVPADLRLFKASNLEIEEAVLTGESVPSTKHINSIKGTVSLADRENMAYSGTTVVAGRGEGIVVAIGGKSEFGQIAELIQKPVEITPLQKRLAHLGKILILISIVFAGIIFILGMMRGYSIIDLFSYAVALLVSAVPEGLPTVTTLALAMGVLAMAKRKAIVKKLPVIEALGSVDVICVDKTGTLTKNEMSIEKIITCDEEVEVEGVGYEPRGDFISDSKKIDPFESSALSMLIEIGDLANNASLERNPQKDKWEIFGDPTEGAFKVLAQKAGHKTNDHEKRIFELPFDSSRQRMSVVHKEDGKKTVYIKGEPKGMLDISSKVVKAGREDDIGILEKEHFTKKINDLAAQGYRLLALGYKYIPQDAEMNLETLENNIVFVGVVAMVDRPDEGVAEAIKEAKNSKIRVIVITGDHKLTTQYVAQKIGLSVSEKEILTGDEIDKMNKEELKAALDTVKIFARVSPQEKLKIVSALKEKGKVVAVTGDGVNDTPALKQADVGIAMGIRGADVSREAADIVLSDDKFSTIIGAIEYGRALYENIKKFLTFLLSANFDEIFLVAIAFAVGWEQPFTAIQILWINLVTDLFPAFALAQEKPHPEIMKEGPRDPKKSMIRPVLLYAGIIGFVASIGGLLIFWWGLSHFDIDKTRTLVFTLAVFFELFIIFSVRSEKPFWKNGDFFGNRWLILAILASIGLQLAAIYTPLSKIVSAVPLGVVDWLVILGISLIGFIIIELIKPYLVKRY